MELESLWFVQFVEKEREVKERDRTRQKETERDRKGKKNWMGYKVNQREKDRKIKDIRYKSNAFQSFHKWKYISLWIKIVLCQVYLCH